MKLSTLLPAAVFAAAALMMASPARSASADDAPGTPHCSRTAALMAQACRLEAGDDRVVALARCGNVAERQARVECLADVAAERDEALALCQAQLQARQALCGQIGEGRYDPDFDPARFDTDFRRLVNPNPYFPLQTGHRWVYAGDGETTTVELLDQRKQIEGVTCIVFRDIVHVDGKLLEATDDWFAAALDGGAWYCGEEVKDYAVFEGDDPARPELVSIDGSFKHGRDGDKAGLIMPAHPKVGQVFREEFSLGNAEDVAEVLSVSYQYGENAALDRGVPAALAQRLCHRDCVVTLNTTPIEPGEWALKYYARGIGFFLETKPDESSALQLVDCNFDDRCIGLPKP